MVGALGTVVVGVIAMAVNGKVKKNQSHKRMRLRVPLQTFVALEVGIIIWASST